MHLLYNMYYFIAYVLNYEIINERQWKTDRYAK